jgi:hypothetical protein
MNVLLIFTGLGLTGLVLFSLAAVCPVRAHVSISWENCNIKGDVVLTLLGRTIFRSAHKQSGRKKKGRLRDFYDLFKEEMRRIVLEELEIRALLNTGSACTTALAAGALWGIVPAAASRFAGYFDAEYLKPDLCIQPEYSGGLRWSLTARCILNAPLDHIIFMLRRWIWFRIRNRFRRSAHERSSY